MQPYVSRITCERAKLCVMQPAIDSADRDKFLVRALFADAVLGDNHDTVSVFDRSKAMGNHERRAPFGQFGERLLDELFRLSIECRCSFVQNKNRWVLEEHARNS